MTKLWLTALLGMALVGSSQTAWGQSSPTRPRPRLTPRLKPRPAAPAQPRPEAQPAQPVQPSAAPSSESAPPDEAQVGPESARPETEAPPPSLPPSEVLGTGFRPPLLPAMRGMDPPAGYVKQTKLNYPLLIGGGFTLAVTYGASLIYMSNQTGLGALGIPVAGPWVAIGQRDFECQVQVEVDVGTDIDDSTDEATECFANEAKVIGVLAGVGIGQLIGSVLLTVGILDQKKRWLRADLAALGLHDVQLEPASSFQGLRLRGHF